MRIMCRIYGGFMKSKLLIGTALISLIFFMSCAHPPRVPPAGEVPVPALPPVEMVRVQGGTFEFGSGPLANMEPVSTVTLTGFYIGKFLITQTQFHAVMGRNPSKFTTANGFSPAPGETEGNRPVESVNWYDAIVFSNRLSIMSGLTPAYEIISVINPGVWTANPDEWGPVPSRRDSRWDNVRIVPGSTGYRLPTEAQWEFAAKGGIDSRNFAFAGSNNPNEVAWHAGNRWDGQRGGDMIRTVGLLQANELGLYDMSGLVWEHVWDWFGPYTAEPRTDPLGLPTGSDRVIRGGSWANPPVSAATIARHFLIPSYRWDFFGFRVVRP